MAGQTKMADQPSQAVAETPLKMKEMFVITCILTSEATCYMYLFPFVPFMVRDFGIVEQDVGFYSGWIAASFMWGQFFSSFLWGWASDKIGIRPVLLFGLFVTIVGSTCFGFTDTLGKAMTIRLCTGLLNSNIGVAKTYIGLVSDATNEARAFGFMSMSWGAGSILGPAIGGLLAQPVKNFPGIFAVDSIWDRNPYLLPSLAAAVLPLCGFIVGIFYLSEPSRDTGRRKRGRGGGGSKKQREAKEMKHIRLEEEEEGEAGAGKEQALHSMEEGRGSALCNGAEDKHKCGEEARRAEQDGRAEAGAGESTLERTASDESSVSQPYRLRRELSALEYARTSKVVLIVCAYGLLRFTAIAQDDATPLFMSTPIYTGGMGMDTKTIGLALLGRGVTLVLMVMFVFPHLKKIYGSLSLAKLAAVIIPVGVAFFPFLKEVQSVTPSWVLYVLMQVYFVLLVFGFSIGFTAVTILVNNSAPPRVIGTVNGFSQSAAALTSAVAPAVAGTLFSWSLTNGLSFPFDSHFVFFFTGLCSSFVGLILYFLPKSIDSRATEDTPL